MYANDPELDDLITSIPRKEYLCVSHPLGATMSADNGSTDQFCQSRTSKQIIELSRVNSITDKAKLIHYFGHCNNHMRKKWCNDIAIGFGRRICEDLEDDLPVFVPHLWINGELMNVHTWVSDNFSISTFSFILSDTHTTFVLTSKRDTYKIFKGNGYQCHVYYETYFPGRVEIPITRALGGYQFDVVFEACVVNYCKRKEIVKWLLYVFPMPKNDSIMQRALYILLRSVEMIAQLRVGAIFFLSVIVPMRRLSAKNHLLAHRKRV